MHAHGNISVVIDLPHELFTNTENKYTITRLNTIAVQCLLLHACMHYIYLATCTIKGIKQIFIIILSSYVAGYSIYIYIYIYIYICMYIYIIMIL